MFKKKMNVKLSSADILKGKTPQKPIPRDSLLNLSLAEENARTKLTVTKKTKTNPNFDFRLISELQHHRSSSKSTSGSKFS